LGSSANPWEACRPEREHDEDRLEEEPDESLRVRVEAECIDPVNVLADIAREDRDEKKGKGDTADPTGPEKEGETENDLDAARDKDDRILIDRDPSRHLCPELVPGEKQVGGARIHHDESEKDAGGGAGPLNPHRLTHPVRG